MSASEPSSGWSGRRAAHVEDRGGGLGRRGARWLRSLGRPADRPRRLQDFYAAVEDHHGDRACALLSADARKALEDQESKPCAQAVEELSLSNGELGPVRVFVTQAAVELRGGDTVFLGDTPDGWLISAAGCRPDEPGKPADCELEA